MVSLYLYYRAIEVRSLVTESVAQRLVNAHKRPRNERAKLAATRLNETSKTKLPNDP